AVVAVPSLANNFGLSQNPSGTAPGAMGSLIYTGGAPLAGGGSSTASDCTTPLDYHHYWGYSDTTNFTSISKCILPYGNQGYPRIANSTNPPGITAPTAPVSPTVAAPVFPNISSDTVAGGQGPPGTSNLTATTPLSGTVTTGVSYWYLLNYTNQ